MPTATATATKSAEKATDGLQRLVAGLQENETAALDAVKRFVDSVNDAFPDLGEDGPRGKIIDAAFAMTQQVINASNRLAISLIDVTENSVENIGKSAS